MRSYYFTEMLTNHFLFYVFFSIDLKVFNRCYSFLYGGGLLEKLLKINDTCRHFGALICTRHHTFCSHVWKAFPAGLSLAGSSRLASALLWFLACRVSCCLPSPLLSEIVLFACPPARPASCVSHGCCLAPPTAPWQHPAWQGDGG